MNGARDPRRGAKKPLKAKDRFRKSPKRKPDKCFVYRNRFKGFNVTCAWGGARHTTSFKRHPDATRFAKSLKCKVIQNSEFNTLSPGLKAAVGRKVPIIMKDEGWSRGQAFAAALSMAVRGTLKPLKPQKAAKKKNSGRGKSRATIKHKRNTR